jgi:hypothetical protein
MLVDGVRKRGMDMANSSKSAQFLMESRIADQMATDGEAI